MRILFFADNFPPERNAAATRVYERAVYWVKWGHDVTVIASAPNFPEGKLFAGYKNRYRVETIDGIRVVRVPTYITANEGTITRLLDFVSYMISGTIAALFQKRPDVVTATSPQFFAAVAGWMTGALRRRPFVFELGDLWPATITGLGAMKRNFAIRMMEKLELFLYRRSSHIVSLTNAFKQNLVERNIPAEKITVVINGVDLQRYAPRPKDEALAREWGLDGKFVAGYIGTHGLSHALENVVHTANVMRDDPSVQFLFVGAGASRQTLIDEAKKLGLTNVTFIPAQPKEIIGSFWSLCDVALVHLKNSEVFTTVIPSKIFEAMGMGLPIIMAGPPNEGSAIVEREGAGLTVPAEDPQALANAIRRMRDDESFRRESAKRSYAAAPNYTREKQAKDVIAVYESVVRK